MGFYDARIKYLYETCPRLVVMSINSIFNKHHSLEAEVHYLDKEQAGEKDDNETFMDMLIQIEKQKYHFEFQLLEDNMAIRMYEYSAKETIREIEHAANQDELHDRYEIEIIMAAQAVIFLAGNNRKNEIIVNMTLPDGQRVTYMLPCISASATVEELIERELFILIPFQQVQLNNRMNNISRRSAEAKHQIALEMYKFHQDVKKGLEKLLKDGKIISDEYRKLIVTFSNLENYLSEKNEEVRQEVKKMGDKDYVCWSDRIEAKAKAESKAEDILEVLEHLGEVPQLLRDKVMTQMDLEILKDWFKLAIKAESITEFEKKIGE